MTMTMTTTLYVRGVGVWAPQVDGRGPAAARPAAELLPVRMRGRASPLTAMLADVVAQAARGARLDPAQLPSVFGSAYGEMSTTLALLQQLSAAGKQLSPAKFQASVHNTAAAQLSIALHNPRFSTSIAAGHDTLAMCWLEACAWLERQPGQVIVACADEAPCAPLQPAATYQPLAAAFVLDNVCGAGLARVGPLLACEQRPNPAQLQHNPVQVALALAAALCAPEPSRLVLNPAASIGYELSIEPKVTAP